MNTIILLAGYPGTGKTYMCNKILSKFPYFRIVSQDEIKEETFDKYGYNNLGERDKIIDWCRDEFYRNIEKNMDEKNDIISDYPFSEKQKSIITKLSNKYDYEIITIRLIADLEVLYERQLSRDLDESRHLSHIMSSYHKGDVVKDRSKADLLVSHDEFINRCKTRGYGEFELGKLIEVDVTDYSKIDYDHINDEIGKFLMKGDSHMNVCCIGQSVYDMTYPIHDDIIENTKYRVTEKFECMGGPATNAAYLNAMWGNKTSLIARLGNDLYGKKIISGLENIGVNTEYIRTCGQDTSVSAVISNLSNGKRTIFNCPANKEDIEFDYPKAVDVILVDGHELKASLEVLELFPKAKSVIDAGTYKPELTHLISKVDYLICSEDFAYQYTDIRFNPSNKDLAKEVFDRLRNLNDKQIVVTMGEKGLLYEKDGNIHHIPAFKCKPVDTTGAGDIFHGAFAYCLAKNYSLEESLRISSMTSAISVETMGGQISIPSLEKVIERIKRA